jgi:hypothetical protein
MHQQLFVEVETEEEAYDKCPWAAIVIEMEGGYHCFRYITDYEIALKQQ